MEFDIKWKVDNVTCITFSAESKPIRRLMTSNPKSPKFFLKIP